MNGSATVKIYPIFLLASIHWINPIHFFGNMLSFVCFIYVIDVFLVDHCHLIPLYCSWGGAVVPPFTQQGEVISAVTQQTATGILFQFILQSILNYFKMSYF